MRPVFTAVVLAAAAILMGASPPTPPPGAPKKLPGTLGPGTELLDRVKVAPFIARGHVLPAPTGGESSFKVHIDRWLKGTNPSSDLVVEFNQQRPITADGHGELLFLAPPMQRADAGKTSDLRAITEPGERYEFPDSQAGAIDQAVLDLIAGAPEDKVLGQLVKLTPRFSVPAASRLALHATRDPGALAAANEAALAPDTQAEARTSLIELLGAKLPTSTLEQLAKGPDERTQLAALAALGRLAANEPDKRPQAVAALQSAASSSNPHVQLAAAQALAGAGQASALPTLDALLAGSDAAVRAEAVRALGELARHGNDDAYARLAKLSTDADPEVKARALGALRELGPRAAPQSSNLVLFAGVSVGIVVALVALFVMRRKKA
ncbi:MAG: HEAT repeat domain-containing protein [Deltaproteobacteria bacterium]|nr:HEAT repeat domain-containing protein [Deltaproteobacteria bacterium]